MKYQIINKYNGKVSVHNTYDTQAEAVEELKRIALIDLCENDFENDIAYENDICYKTAEGDILTADEAVDCENEMEYVFPESFYRWDCDSKYWEIEEVEC